MRWRTTVRIGRTGDITHTVRLVSCRKPGVVTAINTDGELTDLFVFVNETQCGIEYVNAWEINGDVVTTDTYLGGFIGMSNATDTDCMACIGYAP